MNNVVSVASNIRTSASDVLLRKVSLVRMHNCLSELFVDRTSIDTSLRRLFDDDSMKKSMQFTHCLSLNDERTIKFNQGWKQESDVFDEKRQIWIDRFIDPIKDDLFIPRSDVDD